MSHLPLRSALFLWVCLSTTIAAAQQKNPSVLSHDQLMGIQKAKKISPETDQHPYIHRLDLLTESLKESIILRHKIPMEEVCNMIINCPQKPHGQLFRKGDQIKVFTSDQLTEVRLIKVTREKTVVISKTETKGHTAMLVVPLNISRTDKDYYLLFVTAG